MCYQYCSRYLLLSHPVQQLLPLQHLHTMHAIDLLLRPPCTTIACLLLNSKKDIPKRQLTTTEWQVVREAGSVLKPIADVTRMIQGGDCTFIGLVQHRMQQLLAKLQSSQQRIRVGSNDKEWDVKEVTHLHPCVKDLLAVTASVMQAKSLGRATTREEQLAIILDPRFKMRLFTTEAEKRQARTELRAAFFDMVRSDPGGGGAELPVEDVWAGSEEPAAKRARTELDEDNWLDALDTAELEQARSAASAAAAQQAAPPIDAEVDEYLQQPLEPIKDFDMQAFWNKRAYPVLDAEGTVVVPAASPVLALLARQYLGIDSTSCQPERNFSALGNVFDDWRAAMASWKVEMLLFLRLNRHMIPAFAGMLQAAEERQKQAAAKATQVAAVQQAVVGGAAVVNLT
jgi:hypothetical protein